MKTHAVLLTALLSGPAFGACDSVEWMDRPEIPNGLEASYEEMAEARQDVVSYVDAGKAYLDCHEPSPFVNNYIVRRLERVADAFNRERQRFIEARDTVAVN